MTVSSPPPTNGNGYSTREALARIEAKLDVLQTGLEGVRLNFAVHEAKPHHDAARSEIDELKAAVEQSRVKLAAYAGGLVVLSFLAQLAIKLIQ